MLKKGIRYNLLLMVVSKYTSFPALSLTMQTNHGIKSSSYFMRMRYEFWRHTFTTILFIGISWLVFNSCETFAAKAALWRNKIIQICIRRKYELFLLWGSWRGWVCKSTRLKLWCFWSAECGFESPSRHLCPYKQDTSPSLSFEKNIKPWVPCAGIGSAREGTHNIILKEYFDGLTRCL